MLQNQDNRTLREKLLTSERHSAALVCAIAVGVGLFGAALWEIFRIARADPVDGVILLIVLGFPILPFLFRVK